MYASTHGLLACETIALVTSRGKGSTAPTRTLAAVADTPLGESRWPPALALLGFIGLNIALRLWLPRGEAIRAASLIPAIETVLFVMLLASGQRGLAKHARRLRHTALALVCVLVAAALWATILLVYDLIKGTGVTNSAGELLATGSLVWLGNNLTFALLYWLIDSGGPMARAQRPAPIDFAFTQQLSPELAPPGTHTR